MLLSKVPYGNTREQIHLWHGWPQQGRNPKTGYSYSHAALTLVPPRPDCTSSEHFSICFPLEMVWHFVVVRQAHCMLVASKRVDGAAVRKPACWSDWKNMFGISCLSSSVRRSGRGVYPGVALLSRPAMLLTDGIGRVGPQSSQSAYMKTLTLPNTHTHTHALINKSVVGGSIDGIQEYMERDHLNPCSRCPVGTLNSTVLTQRERQLLFWLGSVFLHWAKWNGFWSFYHVT